MYLAFHAFWIAPCMASTTCQAIGASVVLLTVTELRSPCSHFES
ncbi:hypothetical protein NAEX_04483 [Nannocystis exedens]|nr:hypothetical protein NAEX_04483 [Nannocystis exedens]